MSVRQAKGLYRLVVQTLNLKTMELDESFVEDIVKVDRGETKIVTRPVSEGGNFMYFSNKVAVKHAQTAVFAALHNTLIHDAVIEKLSSSGKWTRAK